MHHASYHFLASPVRFPGKQYTGLQLLPAKKLIVCPFQCLRQSIYDLSVTSNLLCGADVPPQKPVCCLKTQLHPFWVIRRHQSCQSNTSYIIIRAWSIRGFGTDTDNDKKGLWVPVTDIISRYPMLGKNTKMSLFKQNWVKILWIMHK